MENKKNNLPYSLPQLKEEICYQLKIKEITPLIQKHINECIADGMTFKEIARCIVWYCEVFCVKNKKEVDPVYGLWFVRNVREQANDYFTKLALEQQQQAAQGKKVVEYQANNIIFNIKNLKHKKRQPKHLNLEEINVEEDK